MPGSVISQERAAAILEPYLDAIGGCLWRAWDSWKETGLPVTVGARSRASLVYDYAADEARQTLPGIEGLRVTEVRRFILVCVEDKLLLRYKKFRGNLRTSGIPTHQQLAFANQQLTIPGMPDVTKLVAGYLLDPFQEQIARVAITCSIGKRLIWHLDIPRPESGTGVVATLQPQPTAPRETAVRSTRTQKPDEREQSS
ncbi:MAG: hypothetical protein M3540_01785 [Actinomycetota bacterium]|nr:hypothetical protein [Actinomycetota bacterium]